MKNKFKWLGLLAVLSFLSLSTTASAGVITFGFGGEGTAVKNCGSLCRSVTITGAAASVPGFDLWSFSGTLQLTKSSIFDLTETVTGLGWTISDGLNSLYGTSSGEFLSFGIGGGALSYVVTGGTGLFAGATGYGGSLLGAIGKKFIEGGLLTVNVPSADVPEPGTTMLLFAGIAIMAVFMARRRRELPKL
jgi:hypothetical protein